MTASKIMHPAIYSKVVRPAVTVASWDVPRRHQGQIVEVSYAGPPAADGWDHGDAARRVLDRSDRSETLEIRTWPPLSPREARWAREAGLID